jgi:hypothetical protein
MWWCMPVIPATWEAELTVWGQPGKKKYWGPNVVSKLGVVLYACNLSYVWGMNRRTSAQADMDKNQDSVWKLTKVKRAGDVAQVIECLSSKSKAFSSHSSTTKTTLKQASKQWSSLRNLSSKR